MTETQECKIRQQVWDELKPMKFAPLDLGILKMTPQQYGAVRFNQLIERENENG